MRSVESNTILSGVAPCTQIRSCVHMASEKNSVRKNYLSTWKSFNKYIYILRCFSWHSVHLVIWFWQLSSARNTSKCHHSALTFQHFPGENPPGTPRKNVAPSALVGSAIKVVPETPLNATILLWLFNIFRGRTPPGPPARTSRLRRS